MKRRRIAMAAGVCVLVGLIGGFLLDRAEAQKKPKPMCNNTTAAAVFRDATGDGLRSDGQLVYGPPLYGSYSEYHGWEDALVCLMENSDYDFILGTTGTAFEKNGFDRTVFLDFGDQGAPVPAMAYEVLIRADYLFNMTPGEGTVDKRLIVWFTVGRTDYKLYFDDDDGDTDPVQVTVEGTAPDRVWTIVSTGSGRLVGPRKMGIVGYYLMPFEIKIYETNQPKTCL
jgi:hypothetical protein